MLQYGQLLQLNISGGGETLFGGILEVLDILDILEVLDILDVLEEDTLHPSPFTLNLSPFTLFLL